MREKTELEILREREEKRKARVKRQNAAYNEKIDRIVFDVPKGMKEAVKEAAKKRGLSVNAFVAGLVLDVVEKDRESLPEKEL